MISDSFKLFGTSTVFEITGEDNGYWIITVKSTSTGGEQLSVRMKKTDLLDGITMKQLVKF